MFFSENKIYLKIISSPQKPDLIYNIAKCELPSQTVFGTIRLLPMT